jgi:hypothetical protein
MHWAKAIAPCCCADAAEEAVVLCVAVEPSCATRPTGEPPHPAANRDSPVVAIKATAVRAPGHDRRVRWKLPA